MASSSNDPTTGAPVFLDADAPDVAVNASEVAGFAASVGTRLIGSTAERTAYSYARAGLAWYDTSDEALYVHNGSGWDLAWSDSGWTVSTSGFSAGTGWSLGYVAYRKVGAMVALNVTVTRTGATITTGSTGNVVPNEDLVLVPAELRPLVPNGAMSGTAAGAVQTGYMATTGYLRLTALAPNGSVANSSDIDATIFYML